MLMDEERRGEHRHRTLEEVRSMRLAAMTEDERAEFEAVYRGERRRIDRTDQSGVSS